jgi:acyl-coenzyme A thioesterase PaaI-like protein
VTGPAPLTNFTCEPDPEHPGWLRWKMLDETRFNEAILGRQLVRREDGDKCRHRMFPQPVHGNSNGNIHGGVSLGLMDVSMFSTLYVTRGIDAGGAVTIDLQAQFIAAGDASRPLDAVVEVLRETHRLAFLRGLLVQDDDLVASFQGTARKPSSPK